MKIKACLIIIFLTGTLISGESINTYCSQLTTEQINELRQGDPLQNSTEDSNIFWYMPEHLLTRPLKDFFLQEQPGLFLEALYLLPTSGPSNGEEQLLFYFNKMREVSKQEGLEYISYNRGNKPYPLITKSWYISDADHRNNRQDDPVVDSLPENDTRYVYQKDSTFGSNVYRHTYTVSEDGFLLSITNVDTLSVMGIVEVAEPEDMQINFVVLPVNEGLICYTIAFIQDPPTIKRVLGYNVNIEGSFNKRIDVLVNWYMDQIENN